VIKIQILLSITMVLVSGCIPDCVQKGPPAERYSSSIEESKKQGVYQYQVFISRNKIPLDTNLSLEIQEAWVESYWASDCINNKRSIIIDTNIKSLIVKSKYIGIRKTGIYYFLGRHEIGANKHYLLHSDILNFYIYKDSNDLSPELKYRIHADSLASVTPVAIAESYRKIRSKMIDSIQFLKD
jgi:hypothetical protein